MTVNPNPPGMPPFMDPDPIVDPARRPPTDSPMDAQTAADLFGGEPYMENGSARGPRQVPAVPGVNVNTPPRPAPVVETHGGPCAECAKKQRAYLLVGIGGGVVAAGATLYLISRMVRKPASDAS